MEPTTGFEPVTPSLPRKCSTPEPRGLETPVGSPGAAARTFLTAKPQDGTACPSPCKAPCSLNTTWEGTQRGTGSMPEPLGPVQTFPRGRKQQPHLRRRLPRVPSVGGDWRHHQQASQDRPAPANGRFAPRVGRLLCRDGRFTPRDGRFTPRAGRFAPGVGRFTPRVGRFTPRHGRFTPWDGRFAPWRRPSAPISGPFAPWSEPSDPRRQPSISISRKPGIWCEPSDPASSLRRDGRQPSASRPLQSTTRKKTSQVRTGRTTPRRPSFHALPRNLKSLPWLSVRRLIL
jgi:hypothetical protein